MARTTPTDVEDIFDTELEVTQLDAWITIASELVDDIQAADSSVTDSRLETIEKLLAAHLAAAQDRRVDEESTGDIDVTYSGETGMGLDATQYGQQAQLLDPTGTLANKSKPTASVAVPDTKGLTD